MARDECLGAEVTDKPARASGAHSCCPGQLGSGGQFPLEGCASILRLGWPGVCGEVGGGWGQMGI